MLLRKGDNNENVKLLQKKLGVDPVGNFGPATEAAVKAFQAKNGLVADGIVGDGTWNKLMGKISGLLDYQFDHYNNILASIKKHSRALDASDTGTGKTYVTVRICKELQLIPFVICPKSVVTSWIKVLKMFGFESKNYFLITYDQLAISDLVSEKDSEYSWNFESDPNFTGDKKKKFLFIQTPNMSSVA